MGIGETLDERVDALFAIRELNDKYGHIQEVIVQNFRAKPDTLFASRPEPSALDVARTAAVARLILGGTVNLQVPPNLTEDGYGFYLLSGINDWGGISPVTRDFINPEMAWPQIAALRSVTGEAGFGNDARETSPALSGSTCQIPDGRRRPCGARRWHGRMTPGWFVPIRRPHDRGIGSRQGSRRP